MSEKIADQKDKIFARDKEIERLREALRKMISGTIGRAIKESGDG